MTLSDNVHL